MKYKKYLTMFLAGTLAVTSLPANTFADTLDQKVGQESSEETTEASEDGNDDVGETTESTTGTTEAEQTTESSTTEEMEDAQEGKSTEEAEDTQEGESTEETEDSQEGESTEDTEDTQEGESTEDTEDTREGKSTEDTEDSQEGESAEETEDSQEGESTEKDAQGSERIEEIKALQGASTTIEAPTIIIQNSYGNNETARIHMDVPMDTEVYFTMDGTEPTTASTMYAGDFDVTTSSEDGEMVVIKAVAVTNEENEGAESVIYSEIVSGEVVFRAKVTAEYPTITATQSDGAVTTSDTILKTLFNIANDDTVEIGIDNPNEAPTSRILYTLDGTEPNESATAKEYTDAFSVTSQDLDSPPLGGTVVLKVTAEVADETMNLYSDTMIFNLKFIEETVEVPEITLSALAEGETKYANDAQVTATVSNYDENLAYYYTLDGTDPTIQSSTYDNTTGITGIKAASKVGGKVELKMVAQGSGGNLSEIATEELYFKAQEDLELAQGSYVVDVDISSESSLKKYIDTKDVELNVDEDGQMTLSIRFVEKYSTGKKETIRLSSPKLVKEDESLTELTLDDWEYTYSYSASNIPTVKKVRVTLPSLSSDITLRFSDKKGNTADYILTLNSEPVLAQQQKIDNSVMGYDISANANCYTYDGYRQKNSAFTVNLKSRGYSQTRPMVYYYTTDDSEEIGFGSQCTEYSILNSFNVKADYGTDTGSVGYIYTKSQDPHTMNLRIKGYVEDLGWTDEISVPMNFNKKALANAVYDANQTGAFVLAEGTFSDNSTDEQYVIPYDTVFKVEEITDADKVANYVDKIDGLNKVDGNGNVQVLNYKLESLDGENVKLLDATGIFNKGKVGIMESDGFSAQTVKVYKIKENGEAVLLECIVASSDVGYGLYSVEDTYPGGIYVVIAEGNEDMPSLSDGYYSVPAKFKEIDNHFKDSEYADIYDRIYNMGYAIINVEASLKELYLPLTNKDGEYITEFSYYDDAAGKYAEASFEETYAVDGASYGKLVKMPITTESAYLDVCFTTSLGKTVYATVEMNYSNIVSSEGIIAAKPEIITATGATTYVNEDKAMVSLSTAATDAVIYFTCTSGEEVSEPDPLDDSQRYTGSFELSTENKEGESFIIKAVTAKSGFITSETATYTVTFQKEGMAAVTAEKPKIYAKYKSGETEADGIYTVTLSTETEGVAIYYTTDGTVPTAETGKKYTDPFEIAAITNGAATVVKAIAVGAGINPSKVAQTTISFSANWWDNIEAGTSYEVPLKEMGR